MFPLLFLRRTLAVALFGLSVVLLLLPQGVNSLADVVAIMPNRATAYPNGLHNGMLLSASRYNLSLEIRDVGNFDPTTSYAVLADAIESDEQPKIYCIWPVDLASKGLVQQLHLKHNVPIIQLNQLPGPDDQWEWEHLLGYAGPDDGLRAQNAGYMMVDAMKARGIEKPRIVALGYPKSYGGYHLSIAAFREAIDGSDIELVESMPLDWGSQNAFNAAVGLIDEMEETGQVLHGIYAMDDDVLKGAYQAFADRGLVDDITLVGTVCNGGRSLLSDGSQYGTTVQSPFLEAVLAIDSVVQYLETGTLNDTVRFTPNPTLTGSGYESMVIEFLGETYVADDLCTWGLEHQRSNGIQDMAVTKNICNWVECLFIPNEIFIAGYALAGINYLLAIVSAVGIWYFQNTKIVSLAQPGFLLLIILGAVIDTTSIIFMSRDNRNYENDQLDRSCIAWTTLLTLGQMVTTATLVAKIYRVRAVMTTGQTNQRGPVSKRAEVRSRDVSGFIIGGLAFDAVLLGAWFGIDPFHWNIRVVNEDASGFILSARGECSSENPNYWLWPLAILAVHFSLLVFANYLAYQTRHYHRISDSKMVAICLFNSIQLLLVASVMLALSGDNVAISYVVRASYAFLNNVGVLVLIIGPKLYLCVTGRGDIMPEVGKNGNRSSVAEKSQSPMASSADSPSKKINKTSPSFSKKSSSQQLRAPASVSRDSWAMMCSVAEVPAALRNLDKIQEGTNNKQDEQDAIDGTDASAKSGSGNDTAETEGLETLLYPSEIQDMWARLGFPSVDHAQAVVELGMKATTPKRRQEIINGAFLRAPSACERQVVGHESMVPPAELKNSWEELGFFEQREALYLLEIMTPDTTSERRRAACELLFDE